jgi:iron complex outermembrane receptor protein
MLAGGAWLLASSVTLAESPEPGVTDRLEDVIITARKRDENLQDVPVAVAAYGADQLRSESVQRISDLGQLAPNLFYGQKVQSGSSAGEIYIRGVGQGDTNATFSPSVGIYVDGVYFGRAQANDLDTADVDRLEVLYGPQGTLFGKNTNGGAIDIVTRKPDPASGPSGSAEIATGSYNELDALGRLAVPLVPDVAALEVSAVRRSQEGYSVRLDGQQQANQNRTGARAQLLLRPLHGLEAILRLDRTVFDEHSAAYRLVEVRGDSSIPQAYAAQTPYRYDNRWVTDSDFSYEGTGPNRNEGVAWGASLTLSWEQPWGRLKSICAYRGLNVESDFDPDGAPLTVLDVFNNVPQHQISQELQGSGTAWTGRLEWVTGLYYFRENARDLQPVNLALELFQGSANFDPQTFILNHNYAAYGQVTAELTSRLRLTLGGRASRDETRVGLQHLGYPVPAVLQPLVTRSAGWSTFLPRASLDYHWMPEVMTYASVAAGSKSGGFNGRAQTADEFNSFEPEKVTTFEVGLRSDWLDERVRVNVTAFYSDYRDFQILVNKTQTVDGKPVAFSFVGNMPRADIRGGELAVSLIPASGWKLFGGLGVTDGRYKEIIAGAPVSLESQFIDTPKLTLTGGAEYSRPLGPAGVLTGRVDYVHKSTIQYDYGNSPLVAQRPYGLLNGRLAWQLPDSHWSVYVSGTNLTDTHYAIGGIDDGAGGSLGEVVKMMGAPREWSVGGRYQF